MTKLKVHGGYYYGDSTTTSNGKIRVHHLCLYQNGIYYDLGGAEIDVLFAKDLLLLAPDIRHIWGLFKIEGSGITIECWNQLSAGCLTTFVQKGQVLNDTTFAITSREKRKNGRASSPAEELYKIYRFRASKNKPDSTNNFIK
jgi:hypothetical protein